MRGRPASTLFNPAVQSCLKCPLARAQRCAFIPTRYQAGALIYEQGAVGDRLYFIREGVVALGSRSSRDSAVSLRGPASMIGIESVRRHPSAVDAWALTDARVCTLSAEEALRWAGPPDSPAQALLELFAQDVTLRQTGDVWRGGESLVRVARFILSAHREGASGTQLLRKQVIARLLDMRPETLSRCLRRLQEDGLISLEEGISIVDEVGLSRLADTERVD